MSRTNISVLIATALLGALLVVVRQFAVEPESLALPTAASPAQKAQEPTTVIAPPVAAQAIAGPARLNSSADLIALLDARGLDGARLLADSADWFQERAFNGPQALFGVTADNSREEYFSRLDQQSLTSLSEAGDAGATLSLGLRRSMQDPFAALALYQRSAAQGGSAALLQIAGQRETFSDIRLTDFSSDAEFVRQLRVLGRNSPDRLLADAFVYASAAVRDAGEPIVDQKLLNWLDSLHNRLSETRRRRVCERSFGSYVNLGTQRRALGLPPVNFKPPPVFLSVPDLQNKLPCNDTNSPIVSTLDLSNCSNEAVIDPAGDESRLVICAAP
jgi:hypothetical protein